MWQLFNAPSAVGDTFINLKSNHFEVLKSGGADGDCLGMEGSSA